MFEQGRDPRSTLLIGKSMESSLVASLIGASHIDDPDDGTTRPVWVDSLDAAKELANARRWSRVIVDSDQPIDLVRSSFSRARLVSTVHDELESYFGRVSIANTTDDLAESAPKKGWLWRGFDIAFALLLLFPTTLLVAAVWIALRTCGSSRVFRRREFVGKGGRVFAVLVIDPELTEVPASRRHFVAASLARQVARLHLVNAMALLNVIRGDMAIVGPSLASPEEFERRCNEWPAYRLRSAVKPGMVSLASARLGRAHTRYDVRRSLEYDLYYVKHRSFIIDSRILLRASYRVVRDIASTFLHIAGTLASLIVRALFSQSAGAQRSAVRFAAPSVPEGLEEELKPTLIVGAGSAGSELIRDLQRQTHLGFWPVVVVDDDLAKLGTRVRGVPVLGTSESIEALVAREGVEEIIVALPSADELGRQRVLEKAKSTGKAVHSIPSMKQLLRGATSTQLVNVEPSDLLGRAVVEIDPTGARQLLAGKKVLVTGAAGSIGSEVVIQALRGNPSVIYGMDINESDLYDLQQSLNRQRLETEFVPIVGSITDADLVRSIFQQFHPDVVFHAGAYKHVPLMETYPHEALKTNIAGTLNIVTASAEFKVERFVMVSTDKAVRPSSVMGASKRIAELIVRQVGAETGLSTCSVRFGNVLGSRGSVIPLFKQQIKLGGPITVTDERMTRYFMTIPEAAGLIIEAGAIGDRDVVYMLDMDEPVRIVDVAERLIRLQGLTPGVDIKIEFTGLRPGEKLFEDLALDFEEAQPTRHPKIRVLRQGGMHRVQPVMGLSQRLLSMIEGSTAVELRNEIMRIIDDIDGDDTSQRRVTAS